MDIYGFLNSKDIAEHCRRLQKTWTPLQMALIISRSIRPVPDKHRAWRELVSDYPDMPVPPVRGCGIDGTKCGFESFHKMILAEIDYEERVLRSFMEQASGAVYRYRIFCEREWYYSDSVCANKA